MYEKIRTLLRQNIFLLVFFSCSFASSYLYRLGSARIDKGQTPGMRDLGTYQFAGRSILDGRNPYINPQVRIGPLGSFFIGILDSLFTPNILAWIALLSVPLGLGLFVKACLLIEGNRFSIAPWLLLIPWYSSTRENLVNIQITGFILILFSSGLIVFVKDQSSKLLEFIGLLLVSIAVETKPHLLLLLFVSICIRMREYRRIFGVVIIIVISHLILSSVTQVNLTSEWLKILLGLKDSSSKAQLPESIAIWPILNQLGISSNVTSASSVILMSSLAIFVLALAIKQPKLNTNLLALAIPSLGFFFHYYDLAIVVSLLVTHYVASGRAKTVALFVGIFVIPENFTDIKSILLLILTIIFTNVLARRNSIAEVALESIKSAFVWLIYAFCIETFGKEFGIHSVAVTISILIVFYFSAKEVVRNRK